jgi:hypothetical protein
MTTLFPFIDLGFSKEQEVVDLMMTVNMTTQDILAGVIFFSTSDTAFEDIENITYKIRFPSLPRQLNKNSKKFRFLGDKNWQTQFMFPIFQTIGPREKGSTHGKDPGKIFCIYMIGHRSALS